MVSRRARQIFKASSPMKSSFSSIELSAHVFAMDMLEGHAAYREVSYIPHQPVLDVMFTALG